MLLLRRLGIVIPLVIVMAVFLASCSGGGGHRVKNSGEFIKHYHLNRLPTFDIPVEINERVIAWVKYFQGPGRKHFRRYLERSGRYIPMMQKVLKEERMPFDLVYISMIESGFNPHAYSHAHAVGLWQFIQSTGRLYGLRVDGWTDERRDPYKATRAAAKHFKDLYKDHGDWYLAMVGYNAGPGRIAKAIQISGSKDFWDMAAHSRALRAETRDYVPKFMAAAIISKMPDRFGFTNIAYEEPLKYEVATVDSQTDLQVIAECAGVSLDEIRDLNPHLHRGATPPVAKYTIRVPEGKQARFKKQYAKIPKNERISIAQYRVRSGDTLNSIARKRGVSVKALASANNIKSSKHLRRGTLLTIPGKAGAHNYASRGSYGRGTTYHSVKRGETAGGIARKYGVRLSQLREWNNLNKHSSIHAGRKLKIYKKGAVASAPVKLTDTVSSAPSTALRPGSDVYYTMAEGETLSEVAIRYGVTVEDLTTWNKIRSSKKVSSGKKIFIKGTDGGSKIDSDHETTAIDLAKLDEQMKRDDIEPVGTRSSRRGSGGTKYHKVKRGETLGVIAGHYKVSTKDLMRWNNIKDAKRMRVGMKLKLYAASYERASKRRSIEPVKLTSVSSNKSGGSQTHQLKRGETLGGVANRYSVSLKQLMAWNNIKDPKRVRAGKTLKIYGGEAPEVSDVEVASAERETITENLVHVKAAPDKVERFYTYKLKSGETLGGVANRHGVTTKQLMAWNNIKNPRSVHAGKKLKIQGSELGNESPEPIAEAEVQPKVSMRAGYKTYTVKSGETLGGIANRHGVTVRQLMVWNNIKNPKSVRAGTKLKIKAATGSVTASSESAVGMAVSSEVSPGTAVKLASLPKARDEPQKTISLYKVQSGDTLWSIARKHNVTIAQLQKWNDLKDPSKVQPGTKLKVQ